FEVKNDKDLSKSIIESYSFEFDQGVDMVGNEIYFSPLFFHKLTENPFKLNERNFPVNFGYASSEKKMINIKIPEGYQVTSTPEPIKLSLPDNMGSFLFNINAVEGGLNVISTFEINTAVIPEFKYAELKEFYNQRVLKETEKVVLTKM
ncbi:MAG: transglutaminase, partial [Bacteroidetes bacterium]